MEYIPREITSQLSGGLLKIWRYEKGNEDEKDISIFRERLIFFFQSLREMFTHEGMGVLTNQKNKKWHGLG